MFASVLLGGGVAKAGVYSPEWPQSPGPADPGLRLRADLSYLSDLVPPFRAAQRDRARLGLSSVWTPLPQLSVWAAGGLARESTDAGMTAGGLDALHLGTRLRPLGGPNSPGDLPVDLPVDLALAWRATLPWSLDAGALGTDETDFSFLIEVGHAFGALRLDLGLGLEILGNPLRFANQDDVPLAVVSSAWTRSKMVVRARVGGELHTPRNPSRLEVSGGVETRGRLHGGLGASLGLSPAAPDWATQLWLGWAWGCLDLACD